jgi:hypothetical protein
LQLYHIGFSFYSTVTRVATRRDTTCYNTEVELRRAAKHATRGCSFIRSAATVSRRPGAALRYNRASTRLSSRRAGSVGAIQHHRLQAPTRSAFNGTQTAFHYFSRRAEALRQGPVSRHTRTSR